MILPTPGRVVWFYNKVEDMKTSQPLSATVAFAHSERCVNLTVHSVEGDVKPLSKVQLLQDDDTPPTKGCFALWMPYQKTQAEKDSASSAQNTPLLELEKRLSDAITRIAELEKRYINEVNKPAAEPSPNVKPAVTPGPPVKQITG